MKPHLITKAKTTEKRSIIGWRCGKWVLRSINVRKSRGQNPALKLAPQTPISKRKRPAPSPTSLANSVIGENNVEVAHPGAGKYRQKGLDHYDQLKELLDGSLVHGAFGQPSTLKRPTSDEETAMYEVGKPIKREDSMSMGKRKLDGSGGTSSKSMRFEKRETTYALTAFANQMRGEYYEMRFASCKAREKAEEEFNIPRCVQLLDEIKPIIGTQQYLKAYNKLLSEESHRKGFVRISQETRVE